MDLPISRIFDGQLAYRGIRDAFARHTRGNGRSSRSQVDNPKKRRERDLFLQFLLAYERLPARRIAVSDAPDFRLSLGQKRIGVEMTEMFVPHPREKETPSPRGSILREQEQLQDAIVTRAMTFHAQTGGAPLRLLISFSDTDFRKRDVEGVARLLAGLIPATAPPNTFLQDDWAAASRWPAWLTDIYVGNRPHALRHIPRWEASHGGFVPALEDFLPAEIRKKELKLPAYRRSKCDHYWLLVIVAEQAASSFGDVIDEKRLYVTEFDHVFVFWPNRGAGEAILRLNCRPPCRDTSLPAPTVAAGLTNWRDL